MAAGAVYRLLHREIRGLHEAAYVLALFTLGSQIMALVRDRLLAHNFGAGVELDVFYAAFRVPDTIYALLASMVSVFVLIPFLEEARVRGTDATRTFLSDMFSFFSAALLVCGLIVFLYTPQLVGLLYGGFSEEMRQGLVPMVRILLIQPLLLGVSNLFAAYVQVQGRFLLYAIAPILYNIGIIIGILFIEPSLGITGLAWGVVLGALLHLLVQTPFIVRQKVLPRLVWPDWTRVRKVVQISIPRTLTLSAQQLVILALVSMAAYFAVGSVSSFSLAWNLQAVPLALIGASYSVAAFPKLARLFGNGDHGEYRTLILTAARQIIFWALPATVLVIVLRAQLVRTIFGTGAFDWDDTMLVGALLALLAVSLAAQGLVVLLVRACYAAGRTMVPLVLNISSSAFTVLLAFGLLQLSATGMFKMEALATLMRVGGVSGSEILLVALAYTLGSIMNMLLLLVYFELTLHTIFGGLMRTTAESLIAALIAGVAAYGALNIFDELVSLRTVFGVFFQGAAAGMIGLVAWLLALITLGSQDLVAAWAALHQRITARRLTDTRGEVGG